MIRNQKIIRQKEGQKLPTRFFSSRQEKQIVKKFGGRQTSNSGSTQFDKGDVKLDNILVEAKTCMKPKDSFSIKKEWLEKIKQESVFMGKENGVLMFNFGPDQKNYVIIEEDLFRDLLDEKL